MLSYDCIQLLTQRNHFLHSRGLFPISLFNPINTPFPGEEAVWVGDVGIKKRELTGPKKRCLESQLPLLEDVEGRHEGCDPDAQNHSELVHGYPPVLEDAPRAQVVEDREFLEEAQIP